MLIPKNDSLSYNQAQDIISLTQYALSRGFQTVSASFDGYIKYPKQLIPYYSLEADSMRFAGTYESIMNELSNTPKGVV